MKTLIYMVLLLVSCLSASARPAVKRESGRVPQYGVCLLKLFLWKLKQSKAPEGDGDLPVEIFMAVELFDGNSDRLSAIDGPHWQDGTDIHKRQRLIKQEHPYPDQPERITFINGTASLYNVIELGSELKFTYASKVKKVALPNGETYELSHEDVQFEDTILPGLNSKGTINFNDEPDLSWPYAECRRTDADWVAERDPGRERRVECNFNC